MFQVATLLKANRNTGRGLQFCFEKRSRGSAQGIMSPAEGRRTMRLRRLKFKDDDGQWYDDAYAFENNAGQVIFRYNLTWEQVGSIYNGKLQETGVSLEEIETVIMSGDEWRWLPIEVVAEEEAASFLETLDEACAIPKPRSIAHRLAA